MRKRIESKKELANSKKGNDKQLHDNSVKVKNNKNKVKRKKINTKKKKNKNKKLIFVLLFLLLMCGLAYFLNEEYKERIRLENLRKEEELVKKITSHYNTYVKTNKDAILYNREEKEVGKISNGVEISLKDTIIDKNTKYFELNDFSGYYIKYQDIEKIEELSTFDTRYKKYIVFNENIVTNDRTSFYDSDNNLVYELKTSFDLPVIIKDNDRYGIEFNGRLLYVKNEDIKEIKTVHNTDVKNSNGVLVLNYHAFYDETSPEETRGCPTIICHSKRQFKTHLDYFKENDILTLTMNEFEMYLDEKIQVPKSVLITIDDGGRTKHGIDMLTEYKMNATVFLVTSWFNPDEFYKSDYIELHSHTHNMHNTGDCPTGQGGGIQCLDRNIILEDLRTSRELLNNTTAFCYPFYEYNSYSISLLKEAGFTMAFAGEWGNLLVKPGVNKYVIPRYVITTSTTISGLDYYFRQIKN